MVLFIAMACVVMRVQVTPSGEEYALKLLPDLVNCIYSGSVTLAPLVDDASI